MELDRIAFSLRWKILAWFFLNLLIVGGMLVVFLHVQFRVGIDSLLAGSTSDRLDALAEPLAAQLRVEPVENWSKTLSRAVAPWRKRGVRAALFRGNGIYVAGDFKLLPPDVVDALERHEASRFPGRPPLRLEPPQPAEDPRAPLEMVLSGDIFEDFRPWDGGDEIFLRKSRGDIAAQPLSTSALDKFMLVAGEPRLYWAGVYLGALHAPTRPGPPRSITLVLASDSLRGGGLFFDYGPWLVLGGCSLLMSMLLWLPLVHNLTKALNGMTRDAEDIAQGRFEVPQASERRDEIGRLGRALGHMATQLESVLKGQKRFLGDTAHELLSPLARLEVALSIIDQRAADPLNQRYTAKALSEVRQISALVRELLSFTKAGLASQPLKLQPVLLGEMVHAAVEREAAGVDVVINVPERCCVMAAPDFLARAIGNGLRNAVRYAAHAGPIEVTAVVRGDHPLSASMVALNITDHGPGVPLAALDRLFDPFFRPEADRARDTGGLGLGLAIVKTCLEACGGSVGVANREPTGLELTFTLQGAG